MHYLDKIWQRISHSGVHKGLSDDMRKKVILCNRMGLVAFIVIFKSEILFFRIPTVFTISLVTSLLYISCIFWNSLRLYEVARLIMIIVPPIGILLNAGFMTNGPATSSKFIVMGIVVCPLLLYQITEKWKMWLGVLWIILVLIFFDTITGWIPRHPEIANDSAVDNPFVSTLNGIVSLLIIGIAFMHVELVDKKYELKLNSQVKRTQKQLQQEKERQEQLKDSLYKNEQLYRHVEEMNKSLSSQALRAQMDPHFMFNALNSIQNFIMLKDSASAIDYVSKFSKLMRQTMESSIQEKITINDELSLLKNYLDLEKLRFDNVFNYCFEIDEQIDADNTEIPTMLLQPFLENAILHGLRHKGEGGELSIIILYQFENMLCVIEDNGIGREKAGLINATREKHRSRGSSVTGNRLAMLNAKGNNTTSVIYIDLKDEWGNAKGTRVEITIPFEF